MGSSSGTSGPLVGPGGAVLVDAGRCPTLFRVVSAMVAREQAAKAPWLGVMEARSHGHVDQADAMAAQILGVGIPSIIPTPAAIEARVGDAAGGEVASLLKKLTGAMKKDAQKIRTRLRELGHRGGLRTV